MCKIISTYYADVMYCIHPAAVARLVRRSVGDIYF